jgi:crotonobetainyl-CoA:carnitine CoA-transferase CaiB-like acyl-CoA transferase
MQAFHGIRVLDLTHVLAGPYATYQLALLGADVIKIESPSRPDMVRGVGSVEADYKRQMGQDFQTQAANKRSMTLDLADPDGRAIFLELVAKADVMVDNYQARSLERLELGWEALMLAYPRLISCSITGFGHTGPKAGRPSYDAVIKAASGFLTEQYGTGRTAGEMAIGPATFDYATGISAAFAIAAALLRRERTGEGQRLDLSMYDTALSLMSANITNDSAVEWHPDPHKWMSQGHPGYRLYDTSDGVLMAGAWTAEQTAAFWKVLGEPTRAEAVREKTIPELESADGDELAYVQDIMLTKTADDWEALLSEADVPAARVRTLAEGAADPQVTDRRSIQQSSEGTHHTIAAFTSPDDGPTISSAPPTMGQHTHEILRWIGKTDAEIDSLQRRGVI